MRGLWTVLASSALVAGCSGGTSDSNTDGKPAAQKTADADSCEHVALGDQGSGTIYASVDKPTNVDCATAQTTVRECGRQQIGKGNTHLPA